MCDTKIKKKEWVFPVQNLAESKKALQQRLKLKREIAKCFHIESEKCVDESKAKTAAERKREYRQRQKSKSELDRSVVDVPGICSKPDFKTPEEQQRDHQKRLKLKRALKKLEKGGLTLFARSDPETKTAKEQNQNGRKVQKLIIINDLTKYCDKGSKSPVDSEQGNQEYGREPTIECGVKKCEKVELIRKELLAEDTAISTELNPECPKLNKDLEKCIEQTSIHQNITRTYNSSAEYFFRSMTEQ